MMKEEFIEELVDLLIVSDRGALEMEEPLPRQVKEYIVKAAIGFGRELLPTLHRRFADSHWQSSSGYVLDVLGEIGDQSSVAHIIEAHKQAGFMSGAAALQALRKIGTRDCYEYMCDLLQDYGERNKGVFYSALKVVTVCRALGEWNDKHAVSILARAVDIRNLDGMPEAAIEALARYSSAHGFLRDLADQEPTLREMVNNALRQEG